MRTLAPMILALLVAGCGPSRQHHQPPEVLAERKNAQGDVLGRFIRESDYSTRFVLLAPDGPQNVVTYKTKYFLQEGDGPKRELSMFHNRKMLFGDVLCYCTSFGAVDDSPLWVAAGVNPVSIDTTAHVVVIDGRRDISHEEFDLHVVVFDEKRIVAHRMFSVALPYTENRFTLTNGNRTVIFKSPEEVTKVYDVLADTVSGPAKE